MEDDICISKDNKINRIEVEFYSRQDRTYFLAFVEKYNQRNEKLMRLLEQ